MILTSFLQEKYKQLKAAEPHIRIRDAAQKLNVSELELLELELGEKVIRLKGNWRKLLMELQHLGYVMVLTRNDYAVHERKGLYQNVSFMAGGKMGVAVNEDIDLRFFMQAWKFGYAVKMEKAQTNLHSFQFFNEDGQAIHKVYLTRQSNPIAFQKILEEFKDKDQENKTRIFDRKKTKTVSIADHKVDMESFRMEWLQLKDTHDFFPLLKKYKLERVQALRMAPVGYATLVKKDASVDLLEMAAAAKVPIMVFVGNSGCIQIHTGTIHQLVPMKNWFNIMDTEFNLHLNLEGVDQCWVVKKPSVDGIISSLEVFDVKGDLIVQFFGKRKPGAPELEEWRKIVKAIQPEYA